MALGCDRQAAIIFVRSVMNLASVLHTLNQSSHNVT